jgi:hypothetical protein
MRTTKASKTSKVKSGTLTNYFRIPIWGKLMVVVLIALVGVYTLMRVLADSSTLYLSPSSTTIQSGSNFTVAVRLSPVSSVDSVQATLTYDSTRLQFVSIDTTNSAFPVELVATGGSGKVDIQRGIFAPASVSADALVANVTFTALSATSSTALNLTGNTAYQGAYLNPGMTSATVTVTAPAPPPPPSDTTPPHVTITSPATATSSTTSTSSKGGGSGGGGKTSSKVIISATATDDSGTVSKMEVYIDGGIVQTSTSSSITYGWSLKGRNVSKGSHTITVKAYDPSGNVGSTSESVTI